jgi:signal transduction histidine kinase
MGLVENIRILLVEDDPDDALLVEEALQEASCSTSLGWVYRVRWVKTFAEASSCLEAEEFHLVLLDLNLPDARGMELLRAVLGDGQGPPVVVLTGQQDEELDAAALKEGAQDYLVKGSFNTHGLCGSIRHALERHKLRQELEKHTAELARGKQRLNRIFETMGDALAITDEQGVIRFANPSACILFGKPAEELAGYPLGGVVREGCAELELPRADGQTLVAEMRSVEMEWEGQPGFLAAFRDITSHKNTLRELDEMRKAQLETKDQFLSHVSHELRTPLTVTQQHTELLRDGLLGELSEDQSHSVAVILRNCHYLEKMIEDLLEATRADAGKLIVDPIRLDAQTLVEEALESVKDLVPTDHVQLALECETDLPPVLADPSRMRQVLSNLLTNAFKFTPAGGKVAISARRDGNDRGGVRFTVADNGPGIPIEDCAHIFLPLFQRKSDPEASRKGLGLGLHICKQLVLSQGGEIWVESQQGKGSSFHCRMPEYTLFSMLAALPEAGLAAGELCLLGLTAKMPPGRELKEYEVKYLDLIRFEMERNLFADRDLLLPRLAMSSRGEVTFVIIGSPEQGGAAQCSRVLGQLHAHPELRNIDLEINTIIRPLNMNTRSTLRDERLRELAATIKPLLLNMVDLSGLPAPGLFDIE